jgi:predicted nucleic-acid-binding Zn-ribbon protein
VSCPKCGCEELSGPRQNVGLCETVWNSYRCTECGFTTVEPADDDWRERKMLDAGLPPRS